MTRTVAERALFVAAARGAAQLEAWRQQKADAAAIRRLAKTSLELFDALAKVLAQSDDYSMEASLECLTRAQELGGVKPTLNPHTELTLKGNAENDYCRSHHYEMIDNVYRAEVEAYWNAVFKRLDSNDRKAPWRQSAEMTKQAKEIRARFYATPLAQLQPTQPRDAATLSMGLLHMESLVKDLLDATCD